MKILILLGLVCAGFGAAQPAHAQLAVYPGAQGFGIYTRAGRGGEIIHVTNLDDSGTGSLRAAVEASGPRIVVFDVSGTITLRDNIIVRYPFMTLAGQTAPSPGITLKGAGLTILSHDILIQHIRVRVGDGAVGHTPDDRDGIGITGNNATANYTNYNVVVDHVSVSWAVDESVSTWYEKADITISNSIISEALHDSLHSKGPHSKGLLIGDRVKRAAVIGNLMAHNVERNILVKGDASAAMMNNVAYNGSGSNPFTYFNDADDRPRSLASIVGNVYIPGADTNPQAPAISVKPGMNSGTRVYMLDNIAENMVNLFVNFTAFNPVTTTNVVWDSSMTRLPASSTEASVLKYSGARPIDRDAVDKRIVNDVKNGTGSIINSQNQVGGWPTLAFNRRVFSEGTNPSSDSDGDGYTNIEEKLHAYAADMEGRIFSAVDMYYNNPSNWTIMTPTTPSKWGWVYGTGNSYWGIKDTNYDAASGDRLGQYAVIKNKTFTNFRFQARAKSSEDFTANAGGDYNVVFGHQNANSYYYMMFSRTGTSTGLYKIVGGTRSLVRLASNFSGVPDNNMHTVKVEKTGSTIRVYFDNVLIVSATDSTFATGAIGIGGYNDASLWDDITISNL